MNLEQDDSEFVEVDPTGRYGRYNEILGKGASKIVYKAFDEYEGIEVAWNQVKLYDFLQSPEDLERLYCEIHLLKTLKHKNIMKFYTSWVDTANRNINFVTEMFTSGTLREYRLKHKRVNIRGVKHWCRQILKGLLYLHSHDPPVIHRDLKCDNIFVNGNHGEVKIGDLGLAAIMRKSHAAHCVGTPEFMAPEVYEEEYNELVDIYAFGMCVLEMVTFEYPYSECTHPAQIYKKVISGKKPDALYKVKDPEVLQFVEKCLATVSHRLSARELLDDPFLKTDDSNSELRLVESHGEVDYVDPTLRQPYYEMDYEGNSFSSYSFNGYSNGYAFEDQNGWAYNTNELEQSGIELFEPQEDEHDEEFPHVDISIKGKRREDGSIFLRLRISDKEGRIRNIYFPFDTESDTALSVASEMVAELDITDQDVTKIAEMIDGEIASLVPEWKLGLEIEETQTPCFANNSYCYNCTSNHTSTGSFLNFLTNNLGANGLQFLQCSGNGCAATHGRFEEITYQTESPGRGVSSGAINLPFTNQSDILQQNEIWCPHESLECSSIGSQEQNDTNQESYPRDGVDMKEKNTKITSPGSEHSKSISDSLSTGRVSVLSHDLSLDDHEHKLQHDLRWLRAKHQQNVRELSDLHLGILPRSPKHGLSLDYGKQKKNGVLLDKRLPRHSDYDENPSLELRGNDEESCPSSESQRARKCEASKELYDTKNVVTGNGLFSTSSFPTHKLNRTTSLPVDAVDL